MAMSQNPDGDTPVSAMNMTPLIDVLLVLLVMFIITIPIATHSVEVDVGGRGDYPAPDPIINRLAITPQDQLLWNGEAINEAQLASVLGLTQDMPVEPQLQFEPAALSSYDRTAKALAIIKGSGVTNFGFVGNERYRTFASGERRGTN